VNVIEGLDQISGELARQWNIECCFEPAQGELEAPGWLLHELRQIVREGSANAVRHGNSQSVSLELNWTQDSICLVISGRASKPLPLLEWKEAPNNQKLRPWSVHERVNNLGGSLSLSTSDVASKLTIVLPREKEE
jgi:signal transduction histidine kinase